MKNKEITIKAAKEKNKKVRVILFSVLAFIFSLGIIVILILMPNLANKIKNLRTQGLVYQLSTQDEVLLVNSLEETKIDRQKILDSFPNETSLLSFIKMVDGLRSDKVNIIKFTLDSDVPTKIGKGSSFIPISLMVSGDEEDVDQVLSNITNSKYFIKTVKFSKEYDSKSNQVMVSTSFHLFVADEFN